MNQSLSQTVVHGQYMLPCQNMLAAGNFAAFSQLHAAYSTLEFTRSPAAGKGTWCLLPTTCAMLPTATKHFDSAGYVVYCTVSIEIP